MTIMHEERPSDSPYVETIMRGWTTSDGSAIRPAECCWHMVFVKHKAGQQSLVVGPWTTAGVASWGEGAEILWVKFKVGTFMPHLPVKQFRDGETVIPQATSARFWLRGSAWQLPDYENADTFIDRLVRDETLAYDPLVDAALQDQPLQVPPRTVRHHFMQATGLTQNHIRQYKRALQAAALLRHGTSILDTVYEAGYFDQPHLTRSLKQFVGYTPAQLIRSN